MRLARRGFSMVELMIAIAIGMFVVGALFSLFTGQMQALIHEDMQAEMHHNARMAMDVLTRTARNAAVGTKGATTGVFGAGGDDDQELQAITHFNGTGPNGSDALTLVGMEPSLLVNSYDTAPPACGTTSLNFNTSVARNTARLPQIHSGELLLCFDYAAVGGFRSWLWEVTADGSATTGEIGIASNTGYSDYDADCASDENLPLIMACSRGEVATFYIDADDSDGVGPGSAAHPVLMMDLDFDAPSANDIPLVDNVEDLQFDFCVDDGDTATPVDCTVPTSWQHTVTATEATRVYMVRMMLVVRSSREDLRELHPGQRPALGDNAGATTTDNYLRTVLSSEVTVRNLRIQNLL